MTAYQNLDNLQNLLIKLTAKASAENAWPHFELPFILFIYLYIYLFIYLFVIC